MKLSDPTFLNAAVLSASDLMTALEACRQLRHVSFIERAELVRFFFGDIQHGLREGKRLPGTNTFFVRLEVAFTEAFSVHGCCCDICRAVMEVPENKWSRAARRALDNMDGTIKLMLCDVCSGKFDRFCSRLFQRDTRIPWSTDLEQMMLAFIASELGATARRIVAGRPPRKRNNEQAKARIGRTDRETIAARSDNPRSPILDWRQQANGHEISEAV